MESPTPDTHHEGLSVVGRASCYELRIAWLTVPPHQTTLLRRT